MLDIKLIREDVEGVIKKLNTRGKDFSYLRELVESLNSTRPDLLEELFDKSDIKQELDNLKGKFDDVTAERDNLITEIDNLREELNDYYNRE